MKSYTITNKLDLEKEANKIVKLNKTTRKYQYTFEQVMDWLRTLPTQYDKVELENAQCTGYFSNLFSHWGTWSVGYTYCLNFAKNPKTREVTISIGTQQTIGKSFYSISPMVA